MNPLPVRCLDGRDLRVTTRAGRCRELLACDAILDASGWRPCGAAATELRADPEVDGRRVRSECRCDEHGGTDRAHALLAADWGLLAPASVGPDHMVTEIGCEALCSPDAIVVIRRETDEQLPERWEVITSRAQAERICAQPGYAAARAILGGSQSFRAAAEAESRAARIAELDQGEGERPRIVHHAASVRARPRPWLAQIGIGSMIEHVAACVTREEALAAARAAWRVRVERDVAEITAQRGGTLGWGLPVRPRSEPIVVEPQAGETAWDAYSRVPRTSAVTDIDCMVGRHSDGSAL